VVTINKIVVSTLKAIEISFRGNFGEFAVDSTITGLTGQYEVPYAIEKLRRKGRP